MQTGPLKGGEDKEEVPSRHGAGEWLSWLMREKKGESDE